MELSPELDLLEQLSGGDISLDAASRLFPTAERFKRVVGIYCQSGAVKVVQRIDGVDRLCQPLRFQTNDPDKEQRDDYKGNSMEHTFQREVHVSRSGRTVKHTVLVGPVERTAHEFACHCAVPFLDSHKARIYGEDALQAIQLCLRAEFVGSAPWC